MQNNPIWNQLHQKAKQADIKNLEQLWQNPERHQSLTFEFEDLYLDLSKNWIDSEAKNLLCQLAEHANLKDAIEDMFNEQIVNTTDQLPATHTTLRDPHHKNYQSNIQAIFDLADLVSSGTIKTAFGKPVTQLVNIGIGGSYLGPRLVVEALTELQSESHIPVFFAASVDDSLINQLFKSIDIEQCLFCISSKSFSTVETLMNARAVEKKLKQIAGYLPNESQSSLMAITANKNRALEAGIPASMILPFDESIGGRFSLWSTIGFPIVLAAGKEKFKELLGGAYLMDVHYRKQPFNQNIPVLMALMTIWYRNFIGLDAYGCLPYDARLRSLPKWLQQLMMESAGKMHNIKGEVISYPTTPWVFGDHGQLSQHAFFQAFHQGVDALPLDFIGVLEKDSNSQDFLLFNLIAQGAALMQGKEEDHSMKGCPGNKPSTTLLLKSMSAKSIGQLLAMYEHMIYSLAVIWNINCFDQPGVELGKAIARDIQEHVENNTLNEMALDPSTMALIKKVTEQ
ncbi:glucose-6-phosphate isomerase [Marinicella litoralis]|uniref:Glucose-6-phosphate isomerase n=1 Tax=Marinicella litoralis TaxID=644220 RepID=A0A4R6XX08_9GAMM|nr:glucose-6-phosphate isomerase [Marinicella litoralis]TDR22794.1 glucose-6-phosphate isomerase [Marinicella litoralis]